MAISSTAKSPINSHRASVRNLDCLGLVEGIGNICNLFNEVSEEVGRSNCMCIKSISCCRGGLQSAGGLCLQPRGLLEVVKDERFFSITCL